MKALRFSMEFLSVARAFNSQRIAIAFLLVSITAIYANALGTPFQFDDFNVIVDYSAVHSLRAWFDSLPGIRPLLKFSYALNWTIDGRPLGFHVVNLCCHLLSALLVFYVARVLFERSPYANAMAMTAALLFAMHPAQTEAITYISGRSVALMSVFYIGALFAGMNDCAGMNERAGVRDLLAPLLFVAALMTKETAWTLPFALLLVHRLRDLSWRESLWRTRWLWSVLLAGVVAIAMIPAYRRMLAHVFSIRSPLDNAALQVDGWWYLLTHTLLLQTNIDPDLPTTPAFGIAWFLKATVLVLGVFAVLCTRQRWLQFAVLWFVLHLLPTNSLLPRNDIANDRQLYLALIGPALALVHASAVLHRRGLRIGLAMLLVVCAAVTWQRNRDYRDEISLWEATAVDSPNKARVWNNLGYAYQLSGRRDAAIAAYDRALSLDANYDRARINRRLLRSGDSTLDQ